MDDYSMDLVEILGDSATLDFDRNNAADVAPAAAIIRQENYETEKENTYYYC